MKYSIIILACLALVGCSSDQPQINPDDIEWEIDKMPQEEVDKMIKEMVEEIRSK